jgi:hypothetical protein
MEGENLDDYIKSFNPLLINKNINTTIRLYSLEMLNFYIQEIELNENEELEFDREYFDILIILLINVECSPVKILLFNIIHGLSFHSEESCGFLLTYENISFLYNCLEGYNIKELNYSLQIFANLIIKLDISIEEIVKFVPIEIKIKELLLSKKYENLYEILFNIIWVLKLIIKNTNPESYVNVKKIIFNIFLIFFYTFYKFFLIFFNIFFSFFSFL